MARDHELATAFADLADTLVSDVADPMHRLVENAVALLDVSEAGLLLSDQNGVMQVMASTAERANLLELFQVQTKEGPSLDCYRTGQPVAVDSLEGSHAAWPTFAPVAYDIGYRAVHAFPMHLRAETVGALSLFSMHAGPLSDVDRHVAQALADVATIVLIHERLVTKAGVVAAQLQRALSSRVVIEQAKGVLAGQGDLDMDQAFARLRERARTTNRRLQDVAADVIQETAGAEVAAKLRETANLSPVRAGGPSPQLTDGERHG